MLGASFLIGGPAPPHAGVQPQQCRLQAGLLFLATVAILIPSVLGDTDAAAEAPAFTHTLSLGLSVLLIVIYALGLVFSLGTHREILCRRRARGVGRRSMADVPCSADPRGVTILVALVSEIFRRIVQQAAKTLGLSPAFVGFIHRGDGRRRRRAGFRRCPPRARIGWI